MFFHFLNALVGLQVLSGFPNLTVALDQQAHSFLRGM